MLALFKKQFLTVCLLFGILVFFVPIAIPEFPYSIVFGVCIIFAGFFWAAFLNYRDILSAQMSAVTVPVEKNKRSSVAISFVPENEYQYSIADPYEGQSHHITRMQKNNAMQCHFDERGIFFINDEVYYLMARGGLKINFQLFNSGDVSLDILSIYVDDNLEHKHLRIYLDGIFQHGSKVRFPIRLEMGEFITLESRHNIAPGSEATDALFASDMCSLPKTILYDVIVNTSNKNGKRQSYVAELQTGSKYLVDLYVNQWREYKQKEYMKLAGDEDRPGS